MRKAPLFAKLLLGLLVMGSLLGLLALYDLYAFPVYHSIKIGMKKEDVDKLLSQAPDSYPHPEGACIAYYLAREGFIFREPIFVVVVFDYEWRAARKFIR